MIARYASFLISSFLCLTAGCGFKGTEAINYYKGPLPEFRQADDGRYYAVDGTGRFMAISLNYRDDEAKSEVIAPTAEATASQNTQTQRIQVAQAQPAQVQQRQAAPASRSWMDTNSQAAQPAATQAPVVQQPQQAPRVIPPPQQVAPVQAAPQAQPQMQPPTQPMIFTPAPGQPLPQLPPGYQIIPIMPGTAPVAAPQNPQAATRAIPQVQAPARGLSASEAARVYYPSPYSGDSDDDYKPLQGGFVSDEPLVNTPVPAPVQVPVQPVQQAPAPAPVTVPNAVPNVAPFIQQQTQDSDSLYVPPRGATGSAGDNDSGGSFFYDY